MRRLFKVGADRHDVGKVTFAWHPDGNFLASAGRNGIVQITDRHGDIVDEIPMSTSSAILALAWDKDGDYLAILQDGNGVVPLWSLSSRRVIPLETNLRDPTFLAWSKTGPQLAVGTAKGNLLIYNKTNKKKIPVVGKHAKRINCGAWSKGGNKLVLGSDDKTLTVSNENGDTILHTELKYFPLQTLFTCNIDKSGRTSGKDDDMISSNLNGKSIHLLNIMDERDEPMELTFAQKDNGVGCKYGDIVDHQWIDDGLIMVSFSSGNLLIVSTNPKDMGQERHSSKFHDKNIACITYNPHLKRVASAGDDGVRIVDLQDFKECKDDYISPEDLEDGKITHLCWSPDGQILTIGTNAGNVYNFLAKMSVLNAKYKTNVAYLSSLREISIVDVSRRARPIDVLLKLEPGLISVGLNYVAAGLNNKVYYHRMIPTGSSSDANEQEYVGTVREIQLNHTYSVVLTDSKATLHHIEQTPSNQEKRKTFPSRDEGTYANITCISLTDEFLYFGTEAGTVEIFFLQEWVLLSGAELRLDNPIKKLFPNGNGTKVVVVDSLNQVYLFNPVTGGGVNQSIAKFENAPAQITSVIWDSQEKNISMLYDGKYIHTYVYVQSSMKGSYLSKLGPIVVSTEGEITLEADKIEIVPGNTPLLSILGVITCQSLNGNLTTIVHPYFDQLSENIQITSPKKRNEEKVGPTTKELSARFCQYLALLKLESAWQTALELDKRQYWLALSNKAMETLNVELASRVYRQLQDASMVMALQECLHIEDTFLLAGHIALLFSDYQRAQDLFLASSRPTAALEMRKDLLQWDQALKLAQGLNTSQIPDICVHYGQQLEFRDDSETALKMFESALNAQDVNGRQICPEELVPTAMKGVARCNLRLGNIRQGIRIANELNDKQLFQECGDILESQKQPNLYPEAVELHIKGEQYEKAAVIYTKHLIKNDKSKIAEAASIMEKVQNDKLHADFAKVCVNHQKYEEAVKAYERANDMDKVVELKLRHLDQVQQAFDIVRASASTQGALLVSQYCQESQTNDFRGAIEFLLIGNKFDEAFKLAQTHSLVEIYATFLGDSITSDCALKVAHYYEKSQDFGKSGKYYSLCGQYQRALKLFFQCGDREINSAIEVVAKSQNEALTHQLIDFLLGEKDGMPKDSNYLYRLYMALKKYEEAAKTALIIAKQEQEEMGNYPVAHSVVFETIRHLEDTGIKVSLQLRQQFILLHSYILVKSLLKAGDHAGAARMLLRVAQSVSKFPKHIVNILTSTVIECLRAGLKSTAYEYAVMLMRPEYRQSIDKDLKRKIEAIVRRRSDKNEEPPEETSPCPVSGELIAITQLECPTTKDQLPMCIVTGRHMVINDWCFCPISKFPALYSEYITYIKRESIVLATAETAGENKTGQPYIPNSAPDPVLGKLLTVKDISLCTSEEATKYIQKYNNIFEVKKVEVDEKEENDASDEKKKSKYSKSIRIRSRKADSSKSKKVADENTKPKNPPVIENDELEGMSPDKGSPRKSSKEKESKRSSKR